MYINKYNSGFNCVICRQCKSERVRYRNDDPVPYCVDGCKAATRCGDIVVPADHLDVSHVFTVC